MAMGRLSRDWVAGGILLIVGGFLLALEHFPDVAFIIPLFIGLALLGAFLALRSPGLLTAGSVITGVGVGILTGAQGSPDFGGAGVLVSIGGGFLLLSLLGALFEVPSVRAWPLAPGFALVALGAVIYAAGSGRQMLDLATRWWPALLVAMGLYLLLAARLRLPLYAGRDARDAVSDETRTGPEQDARAVTRAESAEASEVTKAKEASEARDGPLDETRTGIDQGHAAQAAVGRTEGQTREPR